MTIFGPLGPSLAGYVRSSKTLSRWLKPVSLWYANLAGYRRMGLRYDDLRTFLLSQLSLLLSFFVFRSWDAECFLL